jgi:hypothetical protein
MADIDFQAMLAEMGAPAEQGNPIKTIYEIIPTLDHVQQHLLFQATYFIDKYDLQDVRSVFDRFLVIMRENKPLTFMGSKNLQNLLSAYTQNELVRGVKIQNNNNNGET